MGGKQTLASDRLHPPARRNMIAANDLLEFLKVPAYETGLNSAVGAAPTAEHLLQLLEVDPSGGHSLAVPKDDLGCTERRS
jgi:hypothetical protein